MLLLGRRVASCLSAAGKSGGLLQFSTAQQRRLAENGMKKFEGKVAIVTASTDGIGFGIARRLAQDGCGVMISSRNEANVARAVADLKGQGLARVEGMACHVGKAADRERLVKETVGRMGGVDILVSNAAVNPYFGKMLDCSEEQWDKIFDINVKCALLMTKLVVPEMRKRGKGAIVVVSSIAGFTPFHMLGPYSVSKTALLGLTKALSVELAPENIRVNGIAPGIIKTKFASALTENQDISEKFLDSLPIRRFGSPDDISGVASFLCSDDAAYITGETIVAAGGKESRL